MTDIKSFTTWGVRRGVLWKGWKCFFDRVTILLHQCNDTKITYPQFYSYLRDILHIVKYCFVTRCFSVPLKNCTLATKMNLLPQFLT